MVVEKLEHSRTKLTFDVTPEEFEKALDKAFVEENSKVNIHGFRKGKAPRAVFEKMYGVESLYATAIDVILNDKIQEAVKDENLVKDFIGQFEPLLEDKVERNTNFKVSLVIDTYPEVKLGDYKGIEVAKKNLEVSDDDVEKAVKSMAAKDATMEAKAEQVIAKNDFATFDFVGTVDGVEFPGGKAENYELQIGSGQFIPGFEDQMIGMKAEEVKNINVTFPENYGEASLAGKAAVFKVTVHEIKEQKLPEFTDEYVKSLNKDVNNYDELKAAKRKELEDAKAISEKDRQTNDLINKVIDNATVDMPATLVNSRYNAIKAQYENQAKMYNIPFETFINIMGSTMEQFEDITKKQAERQALFDVVAGAIVEAEKLVPTKEEVDAKAGDDKKANRVQIMNELTYQKLVDFLLANAKEI
ncbi:MAG: trigger factor [Acholeplasmatales bacterium]|nr:trigger factor [Acholeplasmatales bacterium]